MVSRHPLVLDDDVIVRRSSQPQPRLYKDLLHRLAGPLHAQEQLSVRPSPRSWGRFWDELMGLTSTERLALQW
jgi:hypothetical protein